MERHFSLSTDGFERTLAVNYLAPCLLTHLLLPQIRDGVLNMVSLSCEAARFDRDLFVPDSKHFSQLGSYSSSKLALMFFSISLGRRCALRINVADPGIVNTEMIRLHRWFDPLTDVIFRPFCNSPEKGAAPAVRALLDFGSAAGSGLIYKGRHCRDIPSRYCGRTEDIEWLRAETARILKLQ